MISSDLLPHFPGMRQVESIIWAAYMRRLTPAPESINYNVPVGEGITPDPSHPAHIQQMGVHNSRRKIDVVYRVGSQLTIVEVKERAQFGAIGQLLGYQHVWMSENSGQNAPQMLLLTARLSPGVMSASQRYGIQVVVVVADFSGIQGSV